MCRSLGASCCWQPPVQALTGDPLLGRPAQAIMTATAKPLNTTDAAVVAAATGHGTAVLPIDDASCSPAKPAPAPTPSPAPAPVAGPGSGTTQSPKPAPAPGASGLLAPLQLQLMRVSSSSITRYAWAVKFALKPDKPSVKFSDRAAISNELQVRGSKRAWRRMLHARSVLCACMTQRAPARCTCTVLPGDTLCLLDLAARDRQRSSLQRLAAPLCRQGRDGDGCAGQQQ